MADGTARIRRVFFTLDNPDEDDSFNTHLIEYEDEEETHHIELIRNEDNDDMDPEVARMMADLGAERRDLVSAPELDRGQIMHEDPKIAEEYEARRDRIINNAPEDNAEARFLRKWNTATFERDERAEVLQNRYSGQAHRAALNVTFNRHNYITSTAPDHNSSSSEFEPRSFANSNHAGKSNGHHGMRGRSVMKTEPNPNRAPSPRAAGRVRFVNGHRIDITAANGTTGGASPTPLLTQTPILTYNEENLLTAKKNRAVWYAVNPGLECDEHYKNYPNEKPLLRAAYVQCIKEAFMAAKFPNRDSATVERAKTEKRAWMLKEAHKAKKWIENNKLGEAEAYYTANPQHVDFFKAAKANFKPKAVTAVEIIDLTDDLESITLIAATTTPSLATNTVMSEKRKTNGVAQEAPSAISTSQPTMAGTAVTLAKPSVTAPGINSGTPTPKASPSDRVILPAVSRKAADGTFTTIEPAMTENGTVNSLPATITNGDEAPTTPPATANGVIPVTLPGDDSAQAIAAAALHVQQKENQGGMLGFLNACIRDAVGVLISKHTWPIGNQASMDVEAVATPQGLSPRAIISSMQGLAEHLAKIRADADAQVSADADAKEASESTDMFKDGGETDYQEFEDEIMSKVTEYGVPYGLQRRVEMTPDEDGLYDE